MQVNIKFVGLILAALIANQTFSAEYYAAPDGASDAECTAEAPGTIQAAVNKASQGSSWGDGDTVILLPGTYDYTSSSWNNKNCVTILANQKYLTIRSLNNDPASVTLLGPGDRIDVSEDLTTTNGPYTSSAIYVKNSLAKIQGITFTNFNSGSGHLLASTTANTLIVENCHIYDCLGQVLSAGSIVNDSRFVGNKSTGTAAICYCNRVETFFTNCLFVANQAQYALLFRFNGALVNCVASNNISTANSAISSDVSSAVIKDCLFAGNSSIGASVLSAPVGLVVTNCKFIGNSATSSSGAVYRGSYYDCLFEGNSAKGSFGVGADFSAFNCSFIGNTADGEGGAIRLLNNTISNCLFSSNTAGTSGGAIVVPNNYNPKIYSSIFTNNCALGIGAGGGAISGSKYQVYDSRFECNSATNGIGGATDKGGTFYRCEFVRNKAKAVGAISGWSTTTAYNCKIVENSALTSCAACTKVSLYDCLIERNTAVDGDLGVVGQNFKANRCIFTGNYESTVLISSSNISELRNCLFVSNTISSTSAKIAMIEPSAYNCTFIGNKTGGAGILGKGSSNCLLYKNEAIDVIDAYFTIVNCIYENIPSSKVSKSNCIQTSYPDFNMGRNPKLAFYAPSRRSPARDAGVNQDWATQETLDLANNLRLNDVIDIGCYEYHNMGIQTVFSLR